MRVRAGGHRVSGSVARTVAYRVSWGGRVHDDVVARCRSGASRERVHCSDAQLVASCGMPAASMANADTAGTHQGRHRVRPLARRRACSTAAGLSRRPCPPCVRRHWTVVSLPPNRSRPSGVSRPDWSPMRRPRHRYLKPWLLPSPHRCSAHPPTRHPCKSPPPIRASLPADREKHHPTHHRQTPPHQPK